ncbi:MAG: right-handed parallel beta-helix repeat-containing protein [Zoogloeaceae bacterium]|nr:right-handed parallel beta-helix repeat-containing protein [Zoogloeaceae bacterium]
MLFGYQKRAGAGFVFWILWQYAASAGAADYYISASGGNDRYDGRAPSVIGSSGPFASFEPLQSLWLKGGDRVLLKCGDRFFGHIRIRLESSEPGELQITRYGDCPPGSEPVVDGREPLSERSSGALVHVSPALPVEQVFEGDIPLREARFPEHGYLILPEGTSVSATQLPKFEGLPSSPLEGGRLHARTQEWLVEEQDITAPNGRLQSALRYPLRAKAGVYLTGKAWMIGDSPGWAYDSSARILSVRGASGGALTTVSKGNQLEVIGRGSVAISGLVFDAAGGDAIHLRVDGVATVRDVSIRRAIGNGVAIAGAANAVVYGSSIKDVGLDAVFFAEVRRTLVRRNRIVNAGMYAGPRPSLAAINAHRTESTTIDENVVENSAYHGIRFSGDARVRRNYIVNSCLRLSDCGGIYTWRRNEKDRRPAAIVAGNVIIGAGGDTSVKFGVNDWFAGIYLDDYTNSVVVQNNAIVGVNQGIYLHNAVDSFVRNNFVRARLKTVVELVDSARYSGRLEWNNLIESNAVRLGDFAGVFSETTGLNDLFFDGPKVRLNVLDVSISKTAKVESLNCDEERFVDENESESMAGPLLKIFSC